MNKEIIFDQNTQEHAYERAQKNYQLLFDSMLDAMAQHEIICDENGVPCDYRFIQVNPSFEQMTGLKADNLIGKRVLEIIPDLDPSWITRYGKVALTERPERFENYEKTLDRWYEVLAYSPIRGMFCTIFQDITHRKNSEKKLRELQKIIDRTNAIAIEWYADEGWPVKYISQNVRLIGYESDDFLNLTFQDIIHPEDLLRVVKEVDEFCLNKREHFTQEYRVRDGKGEVYLLENQIWVNHECDGHRHVHGDHNECVTSFHGIITDITQKKKDEIQKRKIEAQLNHAAKMASVGTLAAGIAHEINNPLTFAKGFCEIFIFHLKNSQVSNPHLYNLVAKQNEALERIEKIVGGLKVYARADNEKLEAINLNSVITETIAICESIFIKDSVTINFEQNLPPSRVLANNGKMQQVFMNLLINAKDAIKEAGKNGITKENGLINIRMIPEPDGKKVMILVEDNGCGIDNTIIENIFDPFFTTKAPGKGTGLGLSIISSLLQSFNAQIEVKSQSGVGTTFTLIFSLIENEAEGEPSLEKGVLVTLLPQNRPIGKFLIVDDEEDIRYLLRFYLEKMGITDIDEAKNGYEALEKIEQKQFDIVFVDFKMPLFSGVQLIEEALCRGQQCRFIVITGGLLSEYSAQELATIEKQSCVVVKNPFNYDTIVSAITTTLETINETIKQTTLLL